MKKITLALALAALAGTAAAAPIAYPGNTWGTIVYNTNPSEGDTTPRHRIEGIVEQGIDWFRFATDPTWKFNTYGAVEYVINSDTKTAAPVLGMKVNKHFDNGSLDLGLRWKNSKTYISPIGSSPGGQERRNRIEVHATYWFEWNLKKD